MKISMHPIRLSILMDNASPALVGALLYDCKRIRICGKATKLTFRTVTSDVEIADSTSITSLTRDAFVELLHNQDIVAISVDVNALALSEALDAYVYLLCEDDGKSWFAAITARKVDLESKLMRQFILGLLECAPAWIDCSFPRSTSESAPRSASLVRHTPS